MPLDPRETASPLVPPRPQSTPLASLPAVRAAARAHLIGIAGSGMAALADVLAGYGWKISGSDLRPSSRPHVARGHAAEHLQDDVRLVIHSAAVEGDNPELTEARRRGLACLSYPEALAQLTRERRVLAVAGTHGKSTTTALAGAVLEAAGGDPLVVAGAAPLGRRSGGRAGEGAIAVVEACEYRRHFLHLRPEVAVITNIEGDHFDCYPTAESLERAFAEFAASIAPSGTLLIGEDCRIARRVAAAAARCRVETFGVEPTANWRIVAPVESNRRQATFGGTHRFEIVRAGRSLGAMTLRLPGRHNLLNALAAAALAWHGGADAAAIARGLAEFPGLQRRLEDRGRCGGVHWVDDYAHHPTEVAAALATLQDCRRYGRLWCVFEPHQHSRTKRLLHAFARALRLADRVLVAEIFRARERPQPQRATTEDNGAPADVTAADLARLILHAPPATDAAAEDTLAEGAFAQGVAAEDAFRPVVYSVHDDDGILDVLAAELAEGDTLVTMGAGDIDRLGDRLRARLGGAPPCDCRRSAHATPLLQRITE